MAGQSSRRGKGFQDERYVALIHKLVEARNAAGLNQRKFAAMLGRHQQFVSRYETGERRLDIVEFVDVARALGCDVATMVDSVPIQGKADGPKS
jgi:transcriptional regulator with XRE-family HTH domain